MANQTVKLTNGKLNVTVSSRGAELQSIECGGKEYLWNGDPDVWAGRAPVLFPICGGLKDDKYILNGKEYELQKHGYARMCEFEIEDKSDNSAVFLLKSDSESKKVFPFDYELRISYVLDEKSIKVNYSVLNKSDNKMYFSIGGHEGYMCPEGIEEYSLCFDEKERLTTNILNGNLLSRDYELLGDGIDTLKLKYDYFKIDALTFLNLKSRGITLKHKDSGNKIRVEFEGFDYVFVWTKPGAKYICIEPWCGIPDFEGSSYDFTQKTGINSIEPNKTFERTHVIKIEE